MRIINASLFTRLVLLLLALGVWGLLFTLNFTHVSARANGAEARASASFETLTVERINIVDPDGTVRLAIGNRAHPPEARIRGKVYERSIDDMIGFVFYEANGDEAGGLALAKLRDNQQTALIFDYTHQITDGVGIIRRESDDGKQWKAGFFVADRRPYQPGDIESSQGVERISLANEDKTAALVISDQEGRPRIRIGVDENNKPMIEMLGEDGEVAFSADRMVE